MCVGVRVALVVIFSNVIMDNMFIRAVIGWESANNVSDGDDGKGNDTEGEAIMLRLRVRGTCRIS